MEYSPYHKDQTWLEQYGLVKNKNSRAIVANNIYKTIFIKIFFSEVKAGEKISAQEYILPGNKLATESPHEGYLVIFDTKTHAGTVCKPQEHREEDKIITSFIIGIGYREK